MGQWKWALSFRKVFLLSIGKARARKKKDIVMEN
jgi:hypothetical protein